MIGNAERLGVAIQGAGNVATEHLRAYLINPHCEVVAIGSRTLAGAERKARQLGLDPARLHLYDDYAALLADQRVDALSICTPPAPWPTSNRTPASRAWRTKSKGCRRSSIKRMVLPVNE